MANSIKQPSVILTKRDLFVLKGLYDFTLMSFPQMARVFFEGKAKPTVINRLTKLEQCGFITKTKLPRFITGKDKNVISVIYQVSRLGIRVLQKRFSNIEFHPEPVRLQPFSIEHDLLLVDVLLVLKTHKPDTGFVVGEYFCRFKSHLSVKPDAILTDANGKLSVALELELTVKSERRYRDLILKYRLAKDFESVVYITPSYAIKNKIQSLLGGFGMTSKFKFMSLDEVLSDISHKTNNQQSPQPWAESEVKIC